MSKKSEGWEASFFSDYFDMGMTAKEILLFSLISSITRRGNVFYASNKWLAEEMRTTEDAITKTMTSLEKKGLIIRQTRKTRYGTKRYVDVANPCKVARSKRLSQYLDSDEEATRENDGSHPSKTQEPPVKSSGAHNVYSRSIYTHRENSDSVCADCVELSNLPEQSEVTNKQSNQPEQIGALEEKQSARETTEQCSEQICFDISKDVPPNNTTLRRPAPVNPVNLQRILKMFRVRNPNRKLSAAEKRAWDKIKSDIIEDEVAILEKFYAHERSDNYTPLWNRKTQPQTLMNNWHSQVDLAYRWTEEQTPRKELGIVDPNRKLVASKDWRKGARQYVTEMREGPQRDGIIALLRKNDQELTQVDYQTIATFIKEGDW